MRHFIDWAVEASIDVVRTFDPFNNVDNLSVGIDAVRETGKICEIAIRCARNLDHPARPTHDLDRDVGLARKLNHASTQFPLFTAPGFT